jgi:hypothetical protein
MRRTNLGILLLVSLISAIIARIVQYAKVAAAGEEEPIEFTRLIYPGRSRPGHDRPRRVSRL